MFVASRIISMFGEDGLDGSATFAPATIRHGIIEMLRKRGYDKVVKKKRKNKWLPTFF
jgi:hypothetical protein